MGHYQLRHKIWKLKLDSNSKIMKFRDSHHYNEFCAIRKYIKIYSKEIWLREHLSDFQSSIESNQAIYDENDLGVLLLWQFCLLACTLNLYWADRSRCNQFCSQGAFNNPLESQSQKIKQ